MRPDTRSSQRLHTTLFHQGYTLISFSFVVFEIFFLILYTNRFWFALDITNLGLVAIVISLTLGHFLLIGLESSAACILLASIWKKKPPLIYRRFLDIQKDEQFSGIIFGERALTWSAIDRLELNFWGNLEVYSNALCGSSRRPVGAVWSIWSKLAPEKCGEKILTLPFGVASSQDQNLLVQTVREFCPQVTCNEKLTKKLESKEIPSTAYIQYAGVVFLLLVLLDVGQSMFNYLEIMKNYWLTEEAAICSHLQDGELSFKRAEDLRLHPLPFSWVSNKLLRTGKIGSGIFQARADALWGLNRKKEAIESERESMALSPGFRSNLKLARLLEGSGARDEAIEQIGQAIKNHESAFLPRLYRLGLQESGTRSKGLSNDVAELDDRLFGTSLAWPPGGESFLQDVWYRNDLTFVFGHLFDIDKSKPTTKVDLPP